MDSPTSINDQTPKEKPIVITSSNAKKPLFQFSFVNPKILGALTVLLLLIGGVGTGVYLVQQPQQTTSQASQTGVDLAFKPAQIQTSASSQFSLDVFANAGENKINSIDLGFKYDPEVLVLKSISPGQFLTRILMDPKITPGSAFISLGTDSNSGVSGSGIITSLVFEVKDGTSSATQVTFDEETTEIKVLNREGPGSGDTFGKVDVTIDPSTPLQADLTLDNSDIESLDSPAEESDFNNDGSINAIDLSIMYSAWGEPKSDIQKKADLNHDGVVNGIDYAVLLPKLRR